MQVAKVTSNNQYFPSFQRRLTPSEQRDYRQNALQPAFDYLGTQEVAMILHGTCYPESEKDIGVGSPYGKVASKLLPFEMLHGFNSNQLGPVGVIRDAQSISPYKSTVSTRNYLFLDLNELTSDKYARILSQKDIDSVFENPVQTGENYSYSKFPDAFSNYEYCIKIAHKNFKDKLSSKDIDALRLNNEFDDFKAKKASIVYKEALFDVLTKTYGTNNFNKWSELDANLISRIEAKDPEAIARYKKVIHRSKEDFDIYVFGQFLMDKQIKENTLYRKSIGFKYISDLLVGFSMADEWANQDLFLKNYRMGCPYGGKNNGPQIWDIPVLDPNKLFNDDGSLGPAGKLLKQKMESSLDNFDNVRIDHALGLVDPYIYDKSSVVLPDGTVDTSRIVAGNISYIAHVDPNGNYKRVLNEIIIPTLEEHGIDKNYPVWEDLCTDTPTFNHIYRDKNKLPGITQLEYMRAEESQDPDDWGLVGSHDSPPALKMIERDWVKNHHAWNVFYLAGFLNSNPARAYFRDTYCRTIDANPKERVKAKFIELFLTCKKIQISFDDFFGIDKTYNVGGSENNKNWKLRLNKDYEDSYYKNLSSENPTALNMPEILKLAVQAKADMNAVQQSKEYGIEIEAGNEPFVDDILAKLDKYQKILEEPEQ
jgi:hypothetical protein